MPATIEGTQVLGGIAVVDTPLVARAMDYARTLSEPYLFNHEESTMYKLLLPLEDSLPASNDSGPELVIPNPWDTGSAGGLGFGWGLTPPKAINGGSP